MRKYLQITFVLGVFGILVLFRQLKGSDMPAVAVSPIGNQIPASNAAAAIPTSVPTSTPVPSVGSVSITQAPTATPIPVPQGKFKNGNYTGSVQDAFYGNIQVQAIIKNGKITDVIFLQFPNDNRTSQYINSQADPMLKQEAIQAQSAQVDIVSGASASSQAFQASLADALVQAK
jgi:uncharacterized protein with FMN-binding domain